MTYNPKQIGEASEALIAAKLLLAGEIVLQPFGDNQRYDLVVDHQSDFIRIQCKTGRISDGVIKFSCCSNSGGYNKRDYRNEVDYFGVYCPCNEKIYFVHVDDSPSRSMHLRIEPLSAKGPRSNIKWASKYEYTGLAPWKQEEMPLFQ